MRISVKAELLLILKQNGNCNEPVKVRLKCNIEEEEMPICPMDKVCDRLMETSKDFGDWDETKCKKILQYCLKHYSKEDIVEALI